MKTVYSNRYNVFLKHIIAARKHANLTQQILADRLKKPQSFVSKYEQGERRLDIIEFLDICAALDIDPCQIIKNIKEDGK